MRESCVICEPSSAIRGVSPWRPGQNVACEASRAALSVRVFRPASRSASPAGHGVSRAFTLPELMVTAAILSLVVAGVLATNLFGARLYQVTKVKLGATEDARQAINLLISEIRSAKILRIGNGSLQSFSGIADGELQQGTAIQIYATTNTNVFVRYFLDPADQQLKRATNNATDASVVASYVTNTVVFAAEDHLGNVLTNSQNNRVISLTLQFYQIAYPVVAVGPGNYYDFYQLRTRVTRRMLE